MYKFPVIELVDRYCIAKLKFAKLGDNKEEATLFDISDDFRIGKYTNYSLHHFVERVKIYDDEKFNYKFYNINLKND